MNENFFPPVSPEPKGRALWDNRQITNKLEKQLLAYLTQNASEESETNIDNLKKELEKLKDLDLLNSEAINELVTYSSIDKEASDKIDKIDTIYDRLNKQNEELIINTIYDRLNKQNENLIKQIKRISIHYRILRNENSTGKGTEKKFKYLYKILQELTNNNTIKILQELTKDNTAEKLKKLENLETQILDELTNSLNKEREELKNLIRKIKKELEKLIKKIKEIKEILEKPIESNSNEANNFFDNSNGYSNEVIKKIKEIKESKKVVANDVVELLEILEKLERQIKDKDKNFNEVWAIGHPDDFSATPFDSYDPRYINFPDWLKENEEVLGFGFEGGARRTKKRRRSNKAKLARRPQNRVCQRRTSKKRSKN